MKRSPLSKVRERKQKQRFKSREPQSATHTDTHTRWEFIFRAEVHLAGVVLFVDLQHALLVGLEARRVRLLFVRVPFVSRF